MGVVDVHNDEEGNSISKVKILEGVNAEPGMAARKDQPPLDVGSHFLKKYVDLKKKKFPKQKINSKADIRKAMKEMRDREEKERRMGCIKTYKPRTKQEALRSLFGERRRLGHQVHPTMRRLIEEIRQAEAQAL